jgi:hypothetical protein
MADIPTGPITAHQQDLITDGQQIARQIENSDSTTEANSTLFHEKLNLSTEDYQTMLQSVMATNRSDVQISNYQLPTLELKDMGPIPVKDELDLKPSTAPKEMPKH